MNSTISSPRFPRLRRGFLLLAMVSFLAIVPCLGGHAAGAVDSPDPGVTGPLTGTGDNLLSIQQSGVNAPAVAISISGTVSYCLTPANKVPNATVATTSGTPSGTDGTDAVGFYQIDNLGGGPYTIAPTKTGAVSGISAFDAGLTAQIAAGLISPTVCQLLAADASNNGSASAFDAGLIAQTVAGIPNAGIAGTWKFFPASRTYVSLVGNLTNENYDGILVGDVSGNWTPAGPSPNATTAPAANLSISLPNAVAAPGATNFMLPVFVGNTTGLNVIGYDFTFTFNNSVIQLANPAFETAGTLSAGWGIVPVTSTPGQIRIVAFNAMPLTGSGTLIFIKFNVVGAQGATTPLTWTNALFNEGEPVATPQVNGFFTATAPTAVHLGKFTADSFDDGVYLNWKTGFEAENLGFNIYREVAGKRTLVTPDLVAGSALRTGAATRLEAGQSYGWWDKSPGDQDARYFLEEIDINGSRTMHGPFDVHSTGGKPPRESQAALLSQLGRGEPSTHQLALSYQPGRPDVRAGFSALGAVNSSASTLKLASMPAVKMTIKEEGWYRVTQQELAAAGLDPKTDSRRLQLYVGGAEQPMLVSGERDGGFGAIEFFATGQDTVSTDAHVYWLVGGDRAGKRVGVLNGQTNGGGAASFSYTVERRDRSIYFSSLRNGEADNFFGQVVTSNSVDQTVAVSHLDSASGGAAQVEIALQGAIDPDGSADHQVRVLLNGSDLGRITFDGLAHKVQKFAVSPGILKDGDNVFTLVGEASNRDVSLVDYIRVTYQHKYVSDQDALRVTATGPQTIDGFGSAAIRIFDITDPASVVELTGTIGSSGDKYAAGVAAPGQGARTLLALTDDRIKRPAYITANQSSNLKNKKNKANLVIIARREFFPTLEPLRSLRESQGLRVALVDIEDIYDEFSDGERTPQAVKDFLSFATTTWKKAPRFVLFAGHASLDPKNHLGLGDSNLAPTKLIDTDLMETAWDDWFGDFDGDGLSELAIGRLPFRTADEAATMVSKIVSYESSSASSEALFVADNNDGFDFESASSQSRVLMPSGLKASQINRGRVDPDTAKAQLIDALNRGQKLVNYIGHGSTNQWKGDLLTNDDALALTNGGRLSLFVMMTCLNGYSHDSAGDSLAESLLKAQRGGAVAVWASSGMTAPDSQAVANRELYRLLFGQGQKLTVGEAVMRAKSSTPDSDVRRTWVLLGDPTMRIK